MLLMTAMTYLILVLGGALWSVMPHFSRPSIFFGVTVDPQFAWTADGRGFLSRYRASIAAITLLAIATAELVPWPNPGWAIAAGAFIELMGCMWSWILASRRARAFAAPSEPIRRASLEIRRLSLPGGWLFFIGPLIILAIAAWYLHSNWYAIPERFPVHWGINGRPDGWATRSIGGVYGPLLSGFVTNILLLTLAYAIMFLTRQISASGPSAERELAFKRNTYVFLVLILYGMSIMFATLSTRPVWSSRTDELDKSIWAIMLLPLLVSIGFLVYAIRTGQGGARMVSPTETVPIGDGTPDQCWMLGGQIYYNPNDPALMVEKRVGYGWTFNFANKWAWVFMLLLLAAPLLVLLLTLVLR